MHKRKKKTKARRRAKILQERAWKAYHEDNLDMALKLVRQALVDGQDNPTLWNDSGLIHQAADLHDEAEKAWKNAILIAPDFAEPFANLAGLAAGHGRTVQAERLQRKAVDLDPACPMLRRRLAAYRAMLPELGTVPQSGVDATGLVVGTSGEPADASGLPRLAGYDWDKVNRELDERGYAVLEGLLSREQCEGLIELFDQDERFENTVVLDGSSGSGGSYRFFRCPLPWTVHQVRDGVYARLAPIANHVQELLGRTERWPATHGEFLAQCAAAGQERTTPILLRYRAPAENALHQDVWGRVYFPFQMAVTLSPRARDGRDGFEGGELVLADGAGDRKSQQLKVPTTQGDAVVFCTRERLTRFGDTYALHGVRHGMAPLTRGERYVVGIPFHNYK